MIARLPGRPAGTTGDGFVLDVGGVGYLVAATAAALRKARDADEVALDVYTHVREDAIQLFGFADGGERELFVQLLSVNGVGPKVALAVVSGSPAAELRRAIVLEDAARFQAIPGIGKKTAERIGLELKDRLPQSLQAAADAAKPHAPEDQLKADLLSALLNLGYQRNAAEKSIEQVIHENPAASFEGALRSVLRALMR